MMRHRHWLCFLGLLFVPLSSEAFYYWQQDEQSIELRGFVRGVALASDNPNDSFLFGKDEVRTGGVFGRLMLDWQQADTRFELHAVQSYIDPDLRDGGSLLASTGGIERNDKFNWQFADRHADLQLDRLNINYATEKLNITLGRQPINLAASFYFTPNDFFAPFAAQAFFRTYKPGVDALRMDWQWLPQSQLSLFSVLDYPTDNTTTTGRSSKPDWRQTSYLARASYLLDVFQWAILLGEVNNDEIIGFDVQGELFTWLGLRAEGHIRFPDEQGAERDSKIAIAVDRRWPNSFTLRAEHFYQRSGAGDPDAYQLGHLTDSQNIYLARNYTAVGMNYELSPLWYLDGVYLFNHQDASKLLALYSTYSLSDESELALGFNIPMGDQPQTGRIKTEFGAAPHSMTMEYRLYF